MRVAGHEQHFDFGPGPFHFFGQPDARHARHHHIGNHQLDGVGMVFQQRQAFVGAGSFQRQVAPLLQHAADQGTDLRLILDDQDRLMPVGTRRIGLLGLHGRAFPAGCHLRQTDGECRSLAGCALHADVAFALADDAEDGR